MKSYTTLLSLLGAALVLTGGLAYLLNPDAGFAAIGNLALGALLIVAAGAINPDLFRQYGRWVNAFWGAIMVLVIVALVNFLADRYPQRLDLTEGKLHSLSDLTVQTLAGLDRDVGALAFMEGGTHENLETLLKGYAVHSSRFSYEFVDPDREPGRAEEYGVRQYNTLVVEADGQQQKITELQEKEITNALLKVLRDRREVVYLTVGHGESGLGQEPQGLEMLRQRLEEIDYAVEDSLFLAREATVPEDCAVLIIAGPRAPFLANEVETVRRYLERGGSVLVLLDPLYESGLEGLLADWGMQVGDDFVIDTSGIGSLFGLDYTTPVAVNYGDHPITQKHRGLMTFFQLARSVRLTGSGGREGVELVKTSDQGWAETDLSVLQTKGKRSVKLDDGVDLPGPVSLAAAAWAEGEEDEPAGRLVVFGDTDFATNQFFNYQGNGDLVLNALSWLAEDESLISIRPKQAGHNPIALTESQGDWIFWITVVLMPLAVALAGLGIVSRKGRWSLADLAAAGLGVALSLVVVGLLNFLGDRYHHRVDLTEDELFTLDDETKQLIAPLAENGQFVQIKTFMNEMEGLRFQDLLEEYKYLSRNFDYEILDPQKNALEVKQYGVRQTGTSIIELTGGGQIRTERITEQTEEALSNAILQALQARDQKIYFTGGHGEGELDQVDGEGFSILKGRLKEMNFEVVDGLDVEEGVPADATLLAVLSPKQRFTSAEAEAIRRHLDRGGKGLLLLDPGGETGLEGVLDEYSVELGQDFVVDLSGMGQLLGADESVPVVLNYGSHPATEKISQGMMSFFPLARSVSPASHRRREPEIESLLLTHRSSWGEMDLGPVTGGGGKVSFDPDVDLRGPISLAVAVAADADTSAGGEGKTRLAVFGDADFANNQYFGQQGNGQLLVGSVNWLSEGDDKLTIPPKQPRFNPVNLATEQSGVILWVSVFVLPFAVALSGMVIMLRRGYETYVDGFITWLMYSFSGAAVFFFAMGIIELSEGDSLWGESHTAMALISAGIGYGLYRHLSRVWLPALLLSILLGGPILGTIFELFGGLGGLAGLVLSAGSQVWSLSDEVMLLIFSLIFSANVAILVWIHRAFAEQRGASDEV